MKTKTKQHRNILRFFNKWLWISICLILLGLWLEEIVLLNQTSSNIKSLIADTLQSIGLALVIANIFNFILGTEQFIENIREKLIDIVLSKEFITRLNKQDQKKLLKLTLKQTKELKAVYSGIDEYFDEYIDKSMGFFNNCFRGQMNINADAMYDKEQNCLKIYWDLQYINYKVSDKFDSIPFWLGDDKSEHIETQIIGDNNLKQIITNKDLEHIKPEDVKDPSMSNGYTFEVPEEFNKFNEITIRRKFIEYGTDHWQIFGFKAIIPCHRMIITLKCCEGISVKDTSLFGVNEEFDIENEVNKVRFSYNGWLSPGCGVTALISVDSYHQSFFLNKNIENDFIKV